MMEELTLLIECFFLNFFLDTKNFYLNDKIIFLYYLFFFGILKKLLIQDNKKKENKNYLIKMEISDENILGKVYFGKYKTEKKLGEGSFGMIYKAVFNEEEYALKFENRKKGQSLLQSEAYIMSYLKGRKHIII